MFKVTASETVSVVAVFPIGFRFRVVPAVSTVSATIAVSTSSETLALSTRLLIA